MLRHVAYDLSGTDRPMIECDTERLSALLRSLTTQPHPDAAARDAARVTALHRTRLALSDFKWAAWLLLHASKQDVNEHRSMGDASVTITEHIEQIESAIDAAMRASEEETHG
jgi:hypothetical protein